jgi:hypothetical protein
MTSQNVTFETDEHEISVWLTGRAVRCDYGVRGSPVWYEIEDIDADQIEVDGEMFTQKTLAAKFGQDKANEIIETAIDRADADAWEE